MNKRVVITGLGLVTPLGNDVESTWAALCRGESGIAPLTHFDTKGYSVRFGGEIKNFDPTKYIDRKEARRNDRFVHYAIASAKQAIADARLEITPNNRAEIGVIMGTGIGGINTLGEQFKILYDRGPDRVSPFLIPMMVVNMVSGQVAIVTGAAGPNYTTVSACASSGHSIGEAWKLIRDGDAKAMITGGSEAAISGISVAGFASMRALSTRNDDPHRASRPFDAERDGFVIADGAGALVLEDLEYARERGARIYAEVVGYGLSDDAHHITDPAPGGEGLIRAIAQALRKAGLRPEDVDYINAHGTSTQANDKGETQALKGAFGEHAHRLAISSTKSMIGHTLGAAGGIEAAFCVLAIRDQVAPPTINLKHPDPECDLDYIPNEARHMPIKVTMSNSMGFGGHNVSLIIRDYQG